MLTKTHTHTQPKSWESCFIWGITENYRLGKWPSQKALRKCSEEVREEPEYMSFCWNKQKSKKTKHFVQHQKITANHKTQTSWVNHFILVLFYVWKDVRSWACWNYSFDMHLNYLGPLSCFFLFLLCARLFSFF